MTSLRFVLLAAALTGCIDLPDLASVETEVGSTLAPCTAGEFRCLVEAPDGGHQAYAAPRGLGVPELTAAYQIPAAGPGTPTIAIVVAYSYDRLEADLAEYREHYDLPACTTANGCLRIVDQRGGTELPPESPTSNDWSIETMLDLDMASAACPRCNLLVVQAETTGVGLLEGQNTAVALGADVISNSWGKAEVAGKPLAGNEPYFDHPGVAIFAAAGDLGYDSGGEGPSYPATSAHVIAVGGTRLARSEDASNDRGWTESVWAKGGSGCSLSIAKPGYQLDSPCPFRASADIAAVADPSTGVAIYHSRTSGGWRTVGGTSAAAPLVAGIFASANHGHRTAASLAIHPPSFHDITAGKNGNCGSRLCEAGAGWDGPTGFGTPNGTVLASTDIPIDPPDVPDVDEPTVDVEEPAAGCTTTRAPSSFFFVLGLGLVAGALRRRRR